tara:strand:- start:165 stop:629 length:465 start_codon:yes stop_codon:yes gene_type:complete
VITESGRIEHVTERTPNSNIQVASNRNAGRLKETKEASISNTENNLNIIIRHSNNPIVISKHVPNKETPRYPAAATIGNVQRKNNVHLGAHFINPPSNLFTVTSYMVPHESNIANPCENSCNTTENIRRGRTTTDHHKRIIDKDTAGYAIKKDH